ncbi:MAG: hypothetical protein NTX25_00110 [Proteobacteria bacterium]|nr:hypothetical protein [Pseudomonadota bacterium]
MLILCLKSQNDLSKIMRALTFTPFHLRSGETLWTKGFLSMWDADRCRRIIENKIEGKSSFTLDIKPAPKQSIMDYYDDDFDVSKQRRIKGVTSGRAN